MAEPVVFESLEEKINQSIEDRMQLILSEPQYKLPESGDGLVDDYVRKIERRYNVKRAKKDTDNAITLLYMAYNATPQEEGRIRTQIDGLAHDLIAIQQDSEIVMRSALASAEEIVKRLQERFGKWGGMQLPGGKAWIGLRYLDVSEGKNAALLKTFIEKTWPTWQTASPPRRSRCTTNSWASPASTTRSSRPAPPSPRTASRPWPGA